MPEGDTIFRVAEALHRHLAGRIVTRFDSAFPALTRIDHVLTSRELLRHDTPCEPGPALLDASFDATAAVQRARNDGGRAIADVLLNQRVVAGIGNVFKSEILFAVGIHSFTPAGEVSDADLIFSLTHLSSACRLTTAP